jgi:hypothetical protein
VQPANSNQVTAKFKLGHWGSKQASTQILVMAELGHSQIQHRPLVLELEPYFVSRRWKAMKRKWTQREFEAFKKWEKGFDRPIWWMLAVAICLPILGILLSAMTK